MKNRDGEGFGLVNINGCSPAVLVEACIWGEIIISPIESMFHNTRDVVKLVPIGEIPDCT